MIFAYQKTSWHATVSWFWPQSKKIAEPSCFCQLELPRLVDTFCSLYRTSLKFHTHQIVHSMKENSRFLFAKFLS